MVKWFGAFYNQEVRFTSAVKCKKGPLTSLLNRRRNYHFYYYSVKEIRHRCTTVVFRRKLEDHIRTAKSVSCQLPSIGRRTSLKIHHWFFLISCDSNQVTNWFGTHPSAGKSVYGDAQAIVQWPHYVAYVLGKMPPWPSTTTIPFFYGILYELVLNTFYDFR